MAIIGMMLSTTENLYEEEIWSKLSDYVSSPLDQILFFSGKPIASTYEDEIYSNVIFSLIKKMNIDGIISLTGSLNYYLGSHAYKTYVESLTNAPIASISVPIEGHSLVQCDNYQGSFDMGFHCINHGYQRFGIITGPFYSPESKARFKGIKDALKHYHIDEYHWFEGDYSEKSGYELCLKLLHHSPDIIFCSNDLMALGAMKAIIEKGYHFPEDIAVVGFDDIEQIRLLDVPMTTIRQPFGDMACKAFDVLKSGTIDDICIPSQLIVRESCGCEKEFNSIELEEQSKRYYMSKYARSLDEYTLSIRLRASFDQVKDRNQLYDVLDEYMKQINGQQLHLCLLNDSKLIIHDPLNFEWPDVISYAYGYIEGHRFDEAHFEPSEILPREVTEFKKVNAYLFHPLHQQDILYGYIITDSSTAKSKLFTSLKREIVNTLSRLDLMEQVHIYTRQMEKIAQSDMLTGILNRRGFYEKVECTFAADINNGNTPGIIFCDVNGLKKVNDHFGHEVGDRMIFETAKLLEKVFNGNILARMGGDEFVIYVSSCNQTSLDHYNVMLEQAIHEANALSESLFEISLEAGMACYNLNKTPSLDTLIKEADLNLYTKKRFRKSI
jgi:diguanylate cyclase (GGDEF)-like protein